MRAHRIAGILLAGLAVACGGGDAPEGTPGTDDVSSALLSSRTDPGLGTGSSVPVAGSGDLSEAPAGGVPAPGTSGSSVPIAPETDQPLNLSELGYNSGSTEAPVQIVEFSDFGCGYCRRFHEEIFPVLEEEYIETGKVEWKYVPMILGMFPNADHAARAGECAGEQGRFPAVRDRLFAEQQEWKRAGDPMAVLREIVDDEGVDMERWEQCVAEGWQDARIAAGTRLSRQAGVRGTPTFFILGYAPIPGMLPVDVFRQVLDTVYAERTAGSR